MNKNQIDDAIYDFIEEFAFSPGEGISACDIYKGYQNLVNLPNSSDYLVFVQIGEENQESRMEGFTSDMLTRDDGTLTIANLRRLTYQITSVGKQSKQRLDRLITVFNSSKGAEFMRGITQDNYGGAAPVRANSSTDITQPDGTMNYALTYAADFIIAVRIVVNLAQDWTDEIDPTIHNVGV